MADKNYKVAPTELPARQSRIASQRGLLRGTTLAPGNGSLTPTMEGTAMETDNLNPQANGSMDHGSDFRGVIGDAENLLRAVANLSGETIAAAREKLQARIESARGLLAEGEEMAKARAKELATTADGYVRESPWQAVGIGLALGIVIGYLGNRR
jgi:ElaB/YqjD/DUF883 family membrane-anchored ribosome-binding protein